MKAIHAPIFESPLPGAIDPHTCLGEILRRIPASASKTGCGASSTSPRGPCGSRDGPMSIGRVRRSFEPSMFRQTFVAMRYSQVEKRLRAIAEADLVLGIYNPASRSRREQVVETQKILLEHRSPDTVVLVGRDIGRAEESLTVTTLGLLDTDAIDMKCLLIIGASSTRVEPNGSVWTPRWVH